MTIDSSTAERCDLTVMICTLDRPDSLQQTLKLLAGNDFDLARLDVLVIDNSEKCTAREAVRAMSEVLTVRYLHQPTSGKCHALNLGLEAENLAPIIAVLDDDMSPGTDWCRKLLEFSDRWRDTGVFAASSYVIWPDGADIPEWARRPAVACWAMSVVSYSAERYTRPGEFMSGNYFWFRRDAVGARRMPDLWAEAHFVLGLMEDGSKGAVGPEPRCGHRIQPNLLRLDVQKRRAWQFGSHLPRFRMGFPRTVPQARLAAQHPFLWKIRCLANLMRWLLVAVSAPLRSSGNRIPTSLVARVGIANNLQCLRNGRKGNSPSLTQQETQRV